MQDPPKRQRFPAPPQWDTPELGTSQLPTTQGPPTIAGEYTKTSKPQRDTEETKLRRQIVEMEARFDMMESVMQKQDEDRVRLTETLIQVNQTVLDAKTENLSLIHI